LESNEERVQEAYQYVRSTFFPRWDKMGEWIVEVSPNLNIYEEFLSPCFKAFKSANSHNYKTRTLHTIPESEDQLYLMLIHIICDCIYGRKHNSNWCQRMYAASDTALRIGHDELFELIWREVDKYGKWNPNNVYYLIKSAVYERPHASEESIVREVASKLRIGPKKLKRQNRYWKTVYLWHQAFIQGLEEMKKEYEQELDEYGRE